MDHNVSYRRELLTRNGVSPLIMRRQNVAPQTIHACLHGCLKRVCLSRGAPVSNVSLYHVDLASRPGYLHNLTTSFQPASRLCSGRPLGGIRNTAQTAFTTNPMKRLPNVRAAADR